MLLFCIESEHLSEPESLVVSMQKPYILLHFFVFAEGKTLSVIREKKELSGSSTSLNSIGKCL